ncbi:MAG: hypothetical protein H0X38_01740 [Planctomycetes bacterium]|nr:hypothetical protein [Planctomycetota bacterium]
MPPILLRSPIPLLLIAVLTACVLRPLTAAEQPVGEQPIRVICAGDSITQRGYPEVLQMLLGAGYAVHNAGHSGTTALKHAGTRSYPDADPRRDDADIVVIMLGTNDAKVESWSAHRDEFAADYGAVIASFKGLRSHPKVWVSLSPPVFKAEGGGGFSAKNVEEMVGMTRTLAAALGCPIIDVHAAAMGQADKFGDGVHPNDAGKLLIATTVKAAITAPAPVGK